MKKKLWSVAAVATFAMSDGASALEVFDLTKCRALTDVAARASCYDKLVDAAVSKSETATQPSQTAQAAQPGRPVKAPPAPALRTLELAKATYTTSGKAVLQMSDGETWEQTVGERVPTLPAAGTPITIKKGAMGGFFCALDKYTSIRCSPRLDDAPR